MKALLLTHGSRGDVQPFVALACGLTAAGHEVSLVGPRATAEVACSAGVPYLPITDGPLELLNDPVIIEANQAQGRGLRGQVLAMRWFLRNRPRYVDVLADLVKAVTAAGRPDVVVFQSWLPAHHLSESLGVPAVPVCLQPGWVPTPDFPNPLMPARVPRAWNTVSYTFAPMITRLLYGPAVERTRKDLRLPRRRGRHNVLLRPDRQPATVLQAFGRHVLPGTPRYPATAHTTGFWHLPGPADWRMPPSLRAFLDDGPPPVYVGFGSLAGRDPGQTTRTVMAAIRKAGVRAVVATGWGGTTEQEGAGPGGADDVFFVDQAPHDRLFPRMSSIVHHSGAGTTAAALLAGRPQVVCPFAFDQPFWAQRMHACGVAPPPLPQLRLTVDGLAAAIRRSVSTPDLSRRAARFGEQTRAQDGVGNAVQVLEAEVARSGAAPRAAT
ncbi:glycosyltransferase [Streptomyces sp. NPDC048650]|uniref:glycosyltransferase n=1 Tax=Streptomyces sp. NPDC048650 TaxID=3365583 RepID=UPI00371DF77C